MKLCKFCGGTADNSAKSCTNCGSHQFVYVCPNCSGEYEGKFCPTCGTRFDAVAKVCPNCNTKYFSRCCPNCGFGESKKMRTQANSSNARIERLNTLYGGQTNRNAIISIVMSCIGIFTCMFPFSVVGFVLAMGEYKKKDEHDDKTNSMIKASLILSIVGLFIAVLQVIGIVITSAFGK